MDIKKVLTMLSMLAFGLVFVSCSDDPDEPPVVTTPDGITFTQAGTLQWDIRHTFGTVPFDLAPAAFVTAASDTIKVSQLSYYISNIVLTTENGTKVPMPGYFLQNFLPGSPNTITLNNVPAGTYKSISYLIGVDSLANSTNAHTGDLDPNYGMYWTWETGYVFVRLKGRYSVSNMQYSFDIGGTQNVIRMSHNLSSHRISGANVKVSVKFDIEKVFNAPNLYDLKTDPNEIHNDNSPAIGKLSPNIKNAFSITAVQ